MQDQTEQCPNCNGKGKIVKEGGVDEIIEKDILEEVYNIEFCIKDINNNRICVYY